MKTLLVPMSLYRRTLFAFLLFLLSLSSTFAQTASPASKALIQDASSYAQENGVTVAEMIRIVEDHAQVEQRFEDLAQLRV